MRPLDPLSSIKLKLGTVIVVTVVATTAAVVIGLQLGLGWVLSGTVAAAVALAAIQFLARGMTAPLRAMADAATAMSRGDYSRRVITSSRDEVGRLAAAFNQMAAELAEVDRSRRDLVANASHELRTPLTALQAVLENIADGVQEADRETVVAMQVQVDRLRRLVEQLLDLSRLEAGAVPLERSTFEVRSLLREAVEQAELRGDADVSFDVVVEPRDLRVAADRERLFQVVSNLLSNAVRHAPRNSTVSVRARLAPEGVVFEVIDDGPGVRPDEAAKVFERFYRSDSARASSDGGSGLGLAIARWIVDLHGGDITIDSAPGRGCRVSVALPQGVA